MNDVEWRQFRYLIKNFIEEEKQICICYKGKYRILYPIRTDHQFLYACYVINEKEYQFYKKEIDLRIFNKWNHNKEKYKKYIKYYLEVIHRLDSSDNTGNQQFLANKFKMLFYRSCCVRENDLLLNFFDRKIRCNCIEDRREMLLITSSNLSQKRAIRNALNNKISVIQGPPGTGKTTTILNIIANLIFRNKKVLVVSNNNHAVDNVIEEFRNMKDFPACYVRFGKKSLYMNTIYSQYTLIKNTFIQSLKNPSGDYTIDMLSEINEKIKKYEQELNDAIKEKGRLNELVNYHRHLQKRNRTFSFESELNSMLLKRLNRKNWTERSINRIASVLVEMDHSNKIKFLTKLYIILYWHMPVSLFNQQGISIQAIMATKYCEMEIQKKEHIVEKIPQLQRTIEELYQTYISISLKLLNKYMYNNKQTYEKMFSNIPTDLTDKDRNNRVVQDILHYFPVILSTIDALPYCLSSRWGDKSITDIKFDYIILDEATQCDVIKGMSLLSLAKHLVVVGDSKQLSAITNDSLPANLHSPNSDIAYEDNNILKALLNVFPDIPNITLLEHYRCDYHIINYCNKYFYDDKLIIYTNANNHAIQLMNVDKQRASDYFLLDNSCFFSNEREITSILDHLKDNDVTQFYIITPFRGQADKLIKEFNGSNDITLTENNCGTIHTFQGKGSNIVYFSTVLNKSEMADFHFEGSHNLFTNELINVAVSRAKKNFILVTDERYFYKKSRLIKSLIEYIRVYGDRIEDKTVCIFDYLYRQLSTYIPKEDGLNLFESVLKENLERILYDKKYLSIYTHIPLSDLVVFDLIV